MPARKACRLAIESVDFWIISFPEFRGDWRVPRVGFTSAFVDVMAQFEQEVEQGQICAKRAISLRVGVTGTVQCGVEVFSRPWRDCFDLPL